ncbi:mannose-1-phosphate guanylyltransferase [Planctomycetota bacterium]
MNHAVIMAGGTGKRLWPLSRKNRPKQLLHLIDGQTLLYHCFQRLLPVFDKENIIVLTNAGYADLVRENLPELPESNIIAEPTVRDTTGAIGLAASVLLKSDADATMAVLSADHIIKPDETIQNALKDALTFVNKNTDSLMIFGIQPTFPDTRLGYINCMNPVESTGCTNKIYTVKEFKEKPDEKAAKEYIKAGRYFWNSGIFVWKAGTILQNLKKFLPEAAEPLTKIQADWGTESRQHTLQEWFPKLPKISIDFAVMEKAENVHAIKLDCRWLDLGSFNALADIITSDENNNVVTAKISRLLDCKNNFIVTEDKNHLIAAIGLEDMVVAHSPDATLVCPADQTHRLKELLEIIEKKTPEKFL